MLKKLAIAALTLLITALPLSGIAKADTPTNLIANPSLEASANTTSPDSWQTSNYSTVTDGNTAAFSYLNTGHIGGHSVDVNVTKFTDGDANWFYNEVPVTAGTTYQFSDWYQSNIDTEVDAAVTINGADQYFKVGIAFASTGWKNFTGTFTAPAGATSMSIYHLVAGVGHLTTDDYSLAAYTPTPFNRAMVSVTFDDGWENQYDAANQAAMTSNGLVGTYYIISGSSVTAQDPEYMTAAQVKALHDAGNEIGSHTITHPDLTTLSPTELTSEMKDSQTALQNLVGAPVTDFAYPFGAYNSATIAEGSKYYASQRTVNAGYNTKDSLDVTTLKMYEVDSNISQDQVKAWIDGAVAEHAWLILCYHEIATQQTDVANDDALYTTQPADFKAEMDYLKGTNVAVLTVAQALAEAKGQISGVAPIIRPGDITTDGKVNGDDAAILLANWHPTAPSATHIPGDIDGDGLVDGNDAAILLANWSNN